MNPAKVERSRVRHLVDLPNIGPAGAADLRLIHIRDPGQLAGKCPYAMYETLCEKTGRRHDPCVIDVFISITRFMAGDAPRPWWEFTEERRQALKSLETPIEFETQRLRLRQWRPSDRAPFAALNADPRVMACFPSTLDQAASDAMADRCAALIARRGWGFWATEEKTGGQFIGFVGLHVPSPALPFSPCVEIGWRLAFPWWGKGLAAEAARKILRIGFERLDIPEIVAFTAAGNLRSRALMARLGMQEAESFEHPGLPLGNLLRSHCLYRLPRAARERLLPESYIHGHRYSP